MHISMDWLGNLETPYYYEDDGKQPRIAPEVQEWREELARVIRTATLGGETEVLQAHQVIVDVAPYWPNWVNRRFDVTAFLPSILVGVEMGLGIDRSQLIPFVRDGLAVSEEAAGFGIRLYPASFAGHRLTGTLEMLGAVKTIIVLDRMLPVDWRGTRVEINVGVIQDA